MDFDDFFRALAVEYTSSNLGSEDGISLDVIANAEAALGYNLPASLRSFYRVAGYFKPFTEAHNVFLEIGDIHVADNCLVFMEENQAVVHWGFRLSDLCEANPVVWQRNNTPPVEWFSEKKPFTEFVREMLNWYRELGILGAA